MTLTIALAGDAMLGCGVAEELRRARPRPLFSERIRDLTTQADLFVLNLECAVSERGTAAPVRGRPFPFRAPPAATAVLTGLGVDAVSLANDHTVDYGAEALADTRSLLTGAGIQPVGAGTDTDDARDPVILKAGGLTVGLLAVTDHAADRAAGPGRPGVAHADLRRGTPRWLTDRIGSVRHETDITLVSVHWGPTMVGRPVAYVRRAADAFVDAGATLVAGHSAHLFHGFTRHVLFDLGGFIDDYATHPTLRNDLGLLWLVTLDADGPQRTEAVPIALDHAHTRLADQAEYDWIADRLTKACAPLGTKVTRRDNSLIASWPSGRSKEGTT
ncbi:CapA family protein [Streptomyces spectabilis]|uniref:CapA family protein n=1 Tax=Streptomyces spectabilis TaxID=68270 RepID=A0A516R1A7_STRST|nr:CapA family protein [Streptomyces spectabilis]QDQ09445.1 CapA family protein [Streptomyces spectabilis]